MASLQRPKGPWAPVPVSHMDASKDDSSDRSTASFVSLGCSTFLSFPSQQHQQPQPQQHSRAGSSSTGEVLGTAAHSSLLAQQAAAALPQAQQQPQQCAAAAFTAASGQQGPPAAVTQQQQQQLRPKTGYRGLWSLVNSVKRGDSVGNAHGGRPAEEVSVEDLIKQVQRLNPAEPVVQAVLPSLACLDSRALAALLKGLAKAGLAQRAVDIFDYLRALPASDELASLCDIFTYTTMISQCNSHQQLRRAMELVAEMRSDAVPLNVHTYSALLNVCLKANEFDLSLDVYARMLAEGVTPNLVTYNTLLDIHNKTGRWVDALTVLELVQHQNLRPEARTYNAVISTCNGAGRYAEGVRVYEAMTAAGVEPNGASYNAALTSYARSGQLDAALTLFAAMGARGFERGTNTYTAVLAGCERPGRWDLALKLLQQMQSEGLRPSTACLTSAINACLNGGQAVRAEQLFDRLCSVCKPDASTFNSLVCVYCRLGKVREAANMLEIMLRSGQSVEPSTFSTAIDACWATGVVPLQRFAQKVYERAQQQGLCKTLVHKQACAGGYVLDVQLPPGHPCVAVLSLLLLMRDMRDQASTLLTPAADSGSAKVLLRFPVQEEQDASLLSNVLTSQLNSLSSPFVSIEPVPSAALAQSGQQQQGGSEESLQFVAEAAAVAEWLAGAPVALALGQLCQQAGVDGLLACQEDAQRESKCRQAMLSVQSFENNAAINTQAMPQELLPQRAEMVRLLLHNALLLDLPQEAAHDAVQLLDRLLCSPAVGALAANLSGPALTAACLHLVSRRDLSAAPACAATFGVPPQQLLLAVSQVQQVLGSRGCVAISAMRVLQLLLERLAVDNNDAAATLQASGRAVALLNRAVVSFVGCPPSVMAASVLYASRLAAGLLPAWPSALAALTGYTETHAVLQPYIQAAVQLLLDM